MVEKVKLAVVGLGTIGSCHVRDISSSQLADLVGVCDIDHERADRLSAQHKVPAYYDYCDLLDQTNLDGVIISTPHYDHTPISIDALKRGIHVLVEKPIAVHVNDARRMIEAYVEARTQNPDLVFSAMFMERTYGHWRKIKEMIEAGKLGRLVRITWIVTDWYRTQTYYDSGGWRATWRGEGGGLLVNQCPHNFDLYQWLVGLPRRVTGIAFIGKYHNIEVEDEVTAYFDHDNGMIGHFVATTSESPGTNRLEIVGENGKLVYENGQLMFDRNAYSMIEQIRTARGAFDKVEHTLEPVPFAHHGQPGHRFIIENFARAILQGEPLISPAVEGIDSVTLANAIMLSSLERRTVEIPFDSNAYEDRLQYLIRHSRFQKVEKKIELTDADVSKSLQR